MQRITQGPDTRLHVAGDSRAMHRGKYVVYTYVLILSEDQDILEKIPIYPDYLNVLSSNEKRDIGAFEYIYPVEYLGPMRHHTVNAVLR